MNILYIPTEDPRKTNGGNEQRTNLLWESLKRFGRVHTFVLDSELNSQYSYIDGEHPICKLRPNVKGISFWRVISSIVCHLSLLNIYKRKILSIKSPEEVFPGVHFDVVVTRYVQPLCDYNYWKLAPIMIDIDDHPLQVYETVRRKSIPFGLKTIGKYITRWQTDYLIKKSVGGWIANKEQEKLLGNNFVFLPNISKIPPLSYKADNKDRKDFFTVGKMSYSPNSEGVTCFLKQVWPSFHERYPDTQYFIVGKGASEVDVKLWNSFEGVRYLGFVEDLETLYEKTLATIVPVYSGGGTCIKTLEAMAHSRVCFSTKFGARGLSKDVINEEKGILLFEDAGSFINAYNKIMDVKRREEIERQGKNFIISSYSIDSFNKAVNDVMSKLGC